MLLDQIDSLEIFRPKMDSSKEVLQAIATFTADISPSFPYVNAELGGWDYDQTNQVLLLKLSDGKWVTLHPHKIALAGPGTRRNAASCWNGSRGRSMRFTAAGIASSRAT